MSTNLAKPGVPASFHAVVWPEMPSAIAVRLDEASCATTSIWSAERRTSAGVTCSSGFVTILPCPSFWWEQVQLWSARATAPV